MHGADLRSAFIAQPATHKLNSHIPTSRVSTSVTKTTKQWHKVPEHGRPKLAMRANALPSFCGQQEASVSEAL